jgi:hypothetical protein
MLDELRRLLETSPAPALGCVVTGFDSSRRDDEYGFGYRSSYGEAEATAEDEQEREPSQLEPRA